MNGTEGARPTLAALFAARDDRRLVKNRERLHRPGDPLSHVYLVERGWIGRFRSGRDGGEAFTGIHMIGDVIGLDAVRDGELRDEICALSHGSLLRLPLSDISATVKGGGPVALEIAQLLAADSDFLREALFAVGTQSSRERLELFLNQTWRRLLAARLVKSDATRFDLPLTQAQLGAVTGITPVHVNRVLRALRDDGPFSVRGGTVHITDIARLRHATRLPA